MHTSPRRTTTALLPILMSLIASIISGANAGEPAATVLTYPIVDTGQTWIFDNTTQLRAVPRPGAVFYGQDAQYEINPPQYRDNGDGTITDLVTGLMWLQSPYSGDKLTYRDAHAHATRCNVGGHSDWRLPTIKELYSLIQFIGCVNHETQEPYLDTRYFQFTWGREGQDERVIDSQYWSATEYVATTMNGNATVFGVNFADGRIKGYPRDRSRRGPPTQWTLYVRGNPEYGINEFVDNGDGTITDRATGLMWMQDDARNAMPWKEALAYCESLSHAGYDDWRLPSAKELQSLVDYTRSPSAPDASKRGPAIDPLFKTNDPEGWYWSSTTHLDGHRPGNRACYVAFGRATGRMASPGSWSKKLMDVHGAGAQRSDPKSGDPTSPLYRDGLGPQGDIIRIYNHVRAVRCVDPARVRIVTPDTHPIPFLQNTRGHRPPRDPHNPHGQRR